MLNDIETLKDGLTQLLLGVGFCLGGIEVRTNTIPLGKWATSGKSSPSDRRLRKSGHYLFKAYKLYVESSSLLLKERTDWCNEKREEFKQRVSEDLNSDVDSKQLYVDVYVSLNYSHGAH